MLSRCWLGALLVMAAAFPVPAASSGAVVGRVLDAEGTGLAGVMIQVGREGWPKCRPSSRSSPWSTTRSQPTA